MEKLSYLRRVLLLASERARTFPNDSPLHLSLLLLVKLIKQAAL